MQLGASRIFLLFLCCLLKFYAGSAFSVGSPSQLALDQLCRTTSAPGHHLKYKEIYKVIPPFAYHSSFLLFVLFMVFQPNLYLIGSCNVFVAVAPYIYHVDKYMGYQILAHIGLPAFNTIGVCG